MPSRYGDLRLCTIPAQMLPPMGVSLPSFFFAEAELSNVVGNRRTHCTPSSSNTAEIGSLNLLLISAVLLELGVQCVRLFPTTFESSASAKKKDGNETPIGGSIWAGIVHNLKSPYLLGICAYMFLY